MKIGNNFLKEIGVLLIIAVMVLSSVVTAETVNFYNPPPESPSKPKGSTWSNVNVEYTFCTTVTNPDGNMVYYLWDWGDGTTSSWLGPYNPGETVCASHIWSEKGTYCVKVKAKDDHGTESQWSDCLYIAIDDNRLPSLPIINGPKKGMPGREYTYSFYSTDPENDNISYNIDWDDGIITNWTTPQSSGTPYLERHIWDSKKIYTIKAKTQDEHGAESDWRTFTVIMPRNRAINNNLLNNYKDGINEPYFAILSMRGTITDLEILEEHHYHFNATHVVGWGFMIEFLWGYIPIPYYNKKIYNNEEVYVNLKPSNIFNYEKVTENYINYFGICSGYSYDDPLNQK